MAYYALVNVVYLNDVADLLKMLFTVEGASLKLVGEFKVFFNRHIVVEYCVEGDGVANEYCKKFAESGKSASTVAKALLKLTQTNITELLKAKPNGLDEMYLQDHYVYLVTDEGKDANFRGFAGNLNIGTASPYKVCTKHTKAAWDAQVGQPEEPTAPADPSTWWN